MSFPRPRPPQKLLKDVMTGIIIALVSIPISMGYSLVAGLPVAYGLYGSVLPVAVFALVTTSPRFVFGVDAAPAALVGGMLASLGIGAESGQALRLVPVITLLVSLYLAAFFLLRADRLLKFISQPVMGGFITGIGMTIICMQLPKLFGGEAGRGEFPELFLHLCGEARRSFHPPSLLLGAGTVAIILTGKRLRPTLPLQPVLMFAGAALTYFLHIDGYGVKTLPRVSGGLPPFALPDLRLLASAPKDILVPSASIATVILSETLLATNNSALKHGDRIDTRREIAAYSLGNLAAALCGCCPVNGSVSRTGIAAQLGAGSQLMSLTAALSMLLILLFGTGFIAYLPVPVLTGIVISALIGTLEFPLAHRLRRVDKAEFFIFYAALLAVLFLGTIYGVVVGVLLAALTFIIRQAKPAVDFLGIMPGMKGYYSLTRMGTAALPVKGVVIYRFSGPLFYANISQCEEDIIRALRPDTRGAIIDASGVGSVDATAAERLLALYRTLERKGVRLYLTGHVSSVNDQLRTFGAEELIRRRATRAKISFALADLGLSPPYPVDAAAGQGERRYNPRLAEFAWAFGADAERIMQDIARRIAEEVAATKMLDLEKVRERENRYSQGYWSDTDEDQFLDILEIQIEHLKAQGRIQDVAGIEAIIEARHIRLEEQLAEEGAESVEELVLRRHERDARHREEGQGTYERLALQHERYFEELAMNNPALARHLADMIREEEDGGTERVP